MVRVLVLTGRTDRHQDERRAARRTRGAHWARARRRAAAADGAGAAPALAQTLAALKAKTKERMGQVRRVTAGRRAALCTEAPRLCSAQLQRAKDEVSAERARSAALVAGGWALVSSLRRFLSGRLCCRGRAREDAASLPAEVTHVREGTHPCSRARALALILSTQSLKSSVRPLREWARCGGVGKLQDVHAVCVAGRAQERLCLLP